MVVGMSLKHGVFVRIKVGQHKKISLYNNAIFNIFILFISIKIFFFMILYNLETIKKVKELHKQGYSLSEIGAKLGITKNSVHYLIKVDEELYIKKIKQHEEKDLRICEIIKNSNSLYNVCQKLSTKLTNTRKKQLELLIERYNIDISHFGTLTENESKIKHVEYFIENSTVASSKVRNRLLKDGLKEHICEKCKNSLWNGELIPLQLHHINGNHYDNRLENLKLLCPNCHAQTDNYCGKNIKKEEKHIIDKNIKNKIEITKDELIEVFKQSGNFDKTSKYFKTTPKTLKQICIKYGLPESSIKFRHYIINNFGKQNWNLIKTTNINAVNKLKKPVLCYDLNNNFIKEYESAKETLKDGFIPSCVIKNCLGKIKKHKNFIFKYKNEK